MPTKFKSIASFFCLGALAACSGESDGGGGGAPPPSNAAPVFSSAVTAQVDENSTAIAYQATASDPEGRPLTFTLAGGPDAARFSINATTGAVAFLAPPDFESPSDAGANNVYDIIVGASDGQLLSTLSVAITVRDVVDNFRLRRLATTFSQPLFLTGAGDNSGRVFVAEKTGRIRIMNAQTGSINAAPFLDLSTIVSTDSERGLLGLAFAPNYATSGVFFVYITNLAGDTEVRRYQVSADPNVANPNSGDIILTFGQPASNHNGGWIGFGPDGFLYIASGDGGGNVTPANPAQNLSSLLGKILRIDVSGDDFASDLLRDYRIPASNPFAGGGGAPEVFAWGLRNPFRCSFDSSSGRLFIGDVGQNTLEEIDVIPLGGGGRNFGWIRFEGTQIFEPNALAPNALAPSLQYLHGSGPFEGNSVTGGVVNRGPVEALQGQYIFGDFISGNIWSTPADTLPLDTTLIAGQFARQTDAFIPNAGAINNVASFGLDDDRNVYVVDFDGEIFRLERI